jgi:uncharacterized protein YdeI (YjbR/CyaY-like superfamily)
MMKSTSKAPDTMPVKRFKSPEDWASWLNKNHAKSSGLWLRIAKKASGIESVSYSEAVEVALCYGWIDGLKKTYDDTSWVQKFTPRRPTSVWSMINRAKAKELIESGKMKPAGLKAIEEARKSGRWDAAYESPKNATMSSDFQAELDKNPQAKAFFETLRGSNRYAILYRIQTAKKAETREKRIREFMKMLERKEKIYP